MSCVWPQQWMISFLVITGNSAKGLHLAQWWVDDVRPKYTPISKSKTSHNAHGTWWKHGRVFPIGFVKGLQPYALRPDILRKKKEKKTRHHRTAEKHCLKQIAWHKQHPHPRLRLLQPLGSRFHPNLSAQPLQLNHLTNSKQHISAWGTSLGRHPFCHTYWHWKL